MKNEEEKTRTFAEAKAEMFSLEASLTAKIHILGVEWLHKIQSRLDSEMAKAVAEDDVDSCIIYAAATIQLKRAATAIAEVYEGAE